MFKNENDFHDSDIHLLAEVGIGVSYHLAAALTKLGRKVSCPKQEDHVLNKISKLKVSFYSQTRSDLEKGPLQCKADEVYALFLCPENEISLNNALSNERMSRLLKLAANVLDKNPRLKIISLLPMASSQEQVLEFQKLCSQSLVFISPAVYGFRDQALLDFAFQNQIHLTRLLKIENEMPLVFARDVASYIVSAFLNFSKESKVVLIPEQTHSLKDWCDNFKEFSNREALFNFKTIKAYFQKPKLPQLSKDRGTVFNLRPLNADDIFPNAPTKLSRTFKIIREQNEKYPDLESHFPPSRAL